MGIQINGVSNKISSGSQIDFPGSVGVAGTLTYEDVTNIDSIGIVTARTGIKIGPTAGVAGTFFADGSYVTAGVVTATTFHGSGANLTNLDASDLASGTVPTARLGSGTANNTTFLRGDSTFQTVNTDLVADTSPQLGGNLDANSKNILFGDTSGSSNNRLKFGAGPDLEISHNGTDSIIQDAGTGDLKIGGSIVRLTNAAINENMLVATENGAVELYYDNTKKLSTESRGAIVQDAGNITFTVGSTNASGVRICLDGDSNGDSVGNDYAYLQHNTDGNFIIAADNPAQNGQLIFASGNANQRAKFNASGHFLPVSNNTYDLGTSSEQWKDFYLSGSAQLGNNIRTNVDGGGHMYFKNNSQGANYSSHFQTYLSSDEGGTTQTHMHYYHGGYAELLHQGNSSVRTRSGGGVEFRNGNSTKIGTFSPSGLAFGTDTAAANSIHDYEYGSWTPVYAASGGNYGNLTYSVQTGQYVKIGRLVFVQFYINYTFGSVGGNFRVGGLPYSANSYGAGSVMMNNHVTDNGKWYVLHVSNDSYLYLYGTESNTAWASAAADSSAAIIGSCTYYTTT